MNEIYRRLFIRIIATTALLGAVHAGAEETKVTRLRTEKVALFDKPGGTKVREQVRDGFVPGSWAVAGEPQSGYLQVRTPEGNAWVKTFTIDTDRRIAVSAECGVVMGNGRTKVAATRALGEECQK